MNWAQLGRASALRAAPLHQLGCMSQLLALLANSWCWPLLGAQLRLLIRALSSPPYGHTIGLQLLVIGCLVSKTKEIEASCLLETWVQTSQASFYWPEK